MLTRMRRRAVLALVLGPIAALTAGAGAAPAAAQATFVHSFEITLSAANTRALTDRGVVVVPLYPATSRVNGSGTSRTVTLTFPVTSPTTGSSFPVDGGVWFVNTRTWRNSAVTGQQFEWQYPIGSFVGAISSKGGARETWVAGSAQFPGAARSPDSFVQVLNTVAGADVIVQDPYIGSLRQCTDGPCT